MTTNVNPDSIVVGTDGSVDADRAVAWAAEQAQLERRRLVVVSAISTMGQSSTAGIGGTLFIRIDELLHKAQAVADRGAALALQHRPGISVEAVALPGDARSVLADLSSDAHLVVVGSRGRGLIGSKLLGSVSVSLSKHSQCPVVVCRPEGESAAQRGIAVGADGTPASLPIVEFAFRQASLHARPLTVLHCTPSTLAIAEGVPTDPGVDVDLEMSRLVLAESVAGFREEYPDVQVSFKISRGSASDCLAAIAEVHDLVVIGRRPSDSVARRLSGAVSTSVLEHAHSNVAVVPEARAS